MTTPLASDRNTADRLAFAHGGNADAIFAALTDARRGGYEAAAHALALADARVQRSERDAQELVHERARLEAAIRLAQEHLTAIAESPAAMGSEDLQHLTAASDVLARALLSPPSEPEI